MEPALQKKTEERERHTTKGETEGECFFSDTGLSGLSLITGQ